MTTMIKWSSPQCLNQWMKAWLKCDWILLLWTSFLWTTKIVGIEDGNVKINWTRIDNFEFRMGIRMWIVNRRVSRYGTMCFVRSVFIHPTMLQCKLESKCSCVKKIKIISPNCVPKSSHFCITSCLGLWRTSSVIKWKWKNKINN